MILEIATMNVKPDLIPEFEAVFPQAAALSASTPGYISLEMERCIEVKGRYCYMIRWENIDAHMINWRQSANREKFVKLLAKFWAEPTVGMHFEAVTGDRI